MSPSDLRPARAPPSFGSATTENSYLLDGTDFTAPLTGAAWPWPNTDAIEEVRCSRSARPPSTATCRAPCSTSSRGRAATTSTATRNFYFQNQDLTGRNTTDAQDDGLPYHRDEFKDTTLQLGGPVMKDKLWFFGSFQYQKDCRLAARHRPPSSRRESSAKRIFCKLNYQINAKNKAEVRSTTTTSTDPGPRDRGDHAPSTIARRRTATTRRRA